MLSLDTQKTLEFSASSSFTIFIPTVQSLLTSFLTIQIYREKTLELTIGERQRCRLETRHATTRLCNHRCIAAAAAAASSKSSAV